MNMKIKEITKQEVLLANFLNIMNHLLPVTNTVTKKEAIRGHYFSKFLFFSKVDSICYLENLLWGEVARYQHNRNGIFPMIRKPIINLFILKIWKDEGLALNGTL